MNSTKKGKILEGLVALIEKAIDNGNIKVLETNKKISSEIGLDREVDVYIESNFNGRTIRTAIECKNHKSPVGVGDIEAYKSKCDLLKIDKRIYVASNGYQSGAIVTAEHYGIDLCTLRVDSTISMVDHYGISDISLYRKDVKLIRVSCIDEQFKVILDPKLYSRDKKLVSFQQIEQVIGQSCGQLLLELVTSRQGVLLNYRKIALARLSVDGLITKVNRQWLELKSIDVLIEFELQYGKVNPKVGHVYKSRSENVVLATLIKSSVSLGSEVLSLSIINGNANKKFVIENPLGRDVQIDLNKSTPLPDGVDNLHEEIKYTYHNPVKVTRLFCDLADSALGRVIGPTGGTESTGKTTFEVQANNILVLVHPEVKKMFFMNTELIGKKLFAGHLPSPIVLFANYAIAEYHESEIIKKTFPDKLLMSSLEPKLEVVQDITYYKYLQKKFSCISMMYRAINSLLEFWLRKNNVLAIADKYSIMPKATFTEKLDGIKSASDLKLNILLYRSHILQVEQLYNKISDINYDSQTGQFGMKSIENLSNHNLKTTIEEFVNLFMKIEQATY